MKDNPTIAIPVVLSVLVLSNSCKKENKMKGAKTPAVMANLCRGLASIQLKLIKWLIYPKMTNNPKNITSNGASENSSEFGKIPKTMPQIRADKVVVIM